LTNNLFPCNFAIILMQLRCPFKCEPKY